MAEKIEPCMFCGSECEVSRGDGGIFRVICTNDDYECGYRGASATFEARAIGVHNLASIACYRPDASEPPKTGP